MQMGQPEKAKDVFIKISKIDAIFEKTNKHLFNECGMNLRQQNLFDEAIATFEDDAGAYDQADAAGFIKLNALRLRMASKKGRKLS